MLTVEKMFYSPAFIEYTDLSSVFCGEKFRMTAQIDCAATDAHGVISKDRGNFDLTSIRNDVETHCRSRNDIFVTWRSYANGKARSCVKLDR